MVKVAEVLPTLWLQRIIPASVGIAQTWKHPTLKVIARHSELCGLSLLLKEDFFVVAV